MNVELKAITASSLPALGITEEEITDITAKPVKYNSNGEAQITADADGFLIICPYFSSLFLAIAWDIAGMRLVVRALVMIVGRKITCFYHTA